MSTIIRRTAPVAAALAVAVTMACSAPAETDAAPRPVADYSVGENPRDIGDWPAGTIWVDKTFAHKRWPVAAAVKSVRAQTGLDIRVLPAGSTVCYSAKVNCVSVSSDRSNHTGPAGKRLGEVSLWSEGDVLYAADISLDDRDGKKAGKKKRERKLRAYLLQAAGR